MHIDSVFPLLKAESQRWIFTFFLLNCVCVSVGKSIKRESMRTKKRERENLENRESTGVGESETFYLCSVGNWIIHTKVVVYFPPVLASVRSVLQLHRTIFFLSSTFSGNGRTLRLVRKDF